MKLIKFKVDEELLATFTVSYNDKARATFANVPIDSELEADFRSMQNTFEEFMGCTGEEALLGFAISPPKKDEKDERVRFAYANCQNGLLVANNTESIGMVRIPDHFILQYEAYRLAATDDQETPLAEAIISERAYRFNILCALIKKVEAYIISNLDSFLAEENDPISIFS